ncbi:hypothetical protein K431DRAFT_294235 [Polychaeton citri CBS 116435]|uniref:DUF6604 domain-containing protein n=1 Tax=Polychaeton citri CBS 116435 TaxID=1314669 RepID=A0A9P4UQ18_9PEZI|nr:hypothetical protein K431DRAFT_294235 [Polychaeton citri CBS 116435]
MLNGPLLAVNCYLFLHFFFALHFHIVVQLRIAGHPAIMDVAEVMNLSQRYKIGTKFLTQWLAKTAQERCKDKGSLPVLLQATSANNKAILGLTTKDRRLLAEVILKSSNYWHQPPAELNNVIIILKSVIAGRRECLLWYKSRGLESNRNKDASHTYFVDQLDGILQVLQQVLRVYDQKSSQTKSNRNRNAKPASQTPVKRFEEDLDTFITDIDHDSVLNSFTAVGNALPSLEDASDGIHQQPHIVERLAQPVRTLISNMPIESDDDAAFSIWCLLKEYKQVRELVRGWWGQYIDGQISIRAAADSTNAAFHYLEKLTKRFNADYPYISTVSNLISYLDIELVITDSHIRYLRCQSKTLRTGDSEDLHALDLLCPLAMCFLQIFRALAKGSTVEGHDTAPAISLMEHVSNIDDIIGVIWIISTNLEPRIADSEWRKHNPLLDWFTRNILHLWESAEAPLQLLPAMQISMEIRKALENRSMAGSSASIAVIQNVKNTLETLNQTPEAVASRQKLHGYIRAVLDLSGVHEKEYPIRPEYDIFPRWLESNPVLASCVASNIMHEAYLYGIGLCNHQAAVLCMAYLYLASRYTGKLQNPWVDMDTVIMEHGKQSFKLPDTPSGIPDMAALAKCFCISMGVNPKSFLPKEDRSRQRRHDRSEPISSEIQLPSPAERGPFNHVKSTCHHLLTSAGRQPLPSEFWISDKGVEINDIFERFVQSATNADSLSSNTMVKERKKGRPTIHKCTTSKQILSQYHNMTIADEERINFNYASFASVCGAILDQMFKGMRDFNSSLLNFSTPQDMVNTILWDEVYSEAIGNKRRPKRTCLDVFVDLFDEYSENGSALTHQAKKFVTGETYQKIDDESLPRPPTAFGITMTMNSDMLKLSTTSEGYRLLQARRVRKLALRHSTK